MKQIVLFSAFAPTGGGGGTNLRTILPELCERYEILWFYTARQPSRGFEEGWLGAPLVGRSNPVSDILTTASLLLGTPSAGLERIIAKLLNVKCDAYWVVSHNEGLRVALELIQRSSRPVHLTIQDDWAGALCARSLRYRLLATLANNLSDRTIRKVASLDVTSDGMQEYYKKRLGVEGVVIHPLIAGPLPPVGGDEVKDFTVGHVGSLYSRKEFISLLESLAAVTKRVGAQPLVKTWGTPLSLSSIPGRLRRMVEVAPALDETMVVRELGRCRLVYAMYPFRKSLRTFTGTSLPTKLSTYVQAQVPIIAQGPATSTLARFIRDTETGVTWSSMSSQDGQQAILAGTRMKIDRNHWTLARDLYYGRSNVIKMGDVLERLVGTHI